MVEYMYMKAGRAGSGLLGATHEVIVIILSVIGTKRHDQMNKSERPDCLEREYDKSIDFLEQKYRMPQRYRSWRCIYTTDNETTHVDGRQ